MNDSYFLSEDIVCVKGAWQIKVRSPNYHNVCPSSAAKSRHLTVNCYSVMQRGIMIHLRSIGMKNSVVLLCFAMLFSACSTGKVVSIQDRNTQAEITDIDGSLDFIAPDARILAAITIEIAETPENLMKGLMERQEMGQMHGMLFIFDSVKPRGFWMRNTYIPLDIIFIDENGNVVVIAENTTPLSEHIHESLKPIKYVVEVNAGFSRRFDIKKGTRIRWSRR